MECLGGSIWKQAIWDALLGCPISTSVYPGKDSGMGNRVEFLGFLTGSTNFQKSACCLVLLIRGNNMICSFTQKHHLSSMFTFHVLGSVVSETGLPLATLLWEPAVNSHKNIFEQCKMKLPAINEL